MDRNLRGQSNLKNSSSLIDGFSPCRVFIVLSIIVEGVKIHVSNEIEKNENSLAINSDLPTDFFLQILKWDSKKGFFCNCKKKSMQWIHNFCSCTTIVLFTLQIRLLRLFNRNSIIVVLNNYRKNPIFSFINSGDEYFISLLIPPDRSDVFDRKYWKSHVA